MSRIRLFLRKMRAFLGLKDKRKVAFLLIFILFGAIGEFLGIVSIFPFISVVTNPGLVDSNKLIHQVYTSLNFADSTSFFIFLGFIFFVCLVLRMILVTLSTWYIAKYTEYCNYTISFKILSRYLYQPYDFYFQRNTGDLVKNVTSEVAMVIKNVVQPILNIVSNTVNAVFVMAFVFYISPLTSLAAVVFLGILYFIIYFFIRTILSEIGHKRLDTTREKYKIADQALNSIKELKVLRREDFFLEKFSQFSKEYAAAQVKSVVISEVSRNVMEAVVFFAILGAVLWFLITQGSINLILPLLSLYGLTIYRLMPVFQSIFTSTARAKFNMPTLDFLYKDLVLANTEKIYPPDRGIQLKENIQLENISYTYPSKDTPAVSNVNLSIKAGTTVGFAGVTGSGKTTLVDIILGLLDPTSGCISIDGKKLTTDDIKSWQNIIGYVPQNICLVDDTAKRNIALGIHDEDINMDRLKKAAQAADMADFIENELPEKYDTNVGDKGVCLSGGQRQRIGIARALYREPQILIFDEATSSLDTITEATIVHSIKKLEENKTILMIAHRLDTLKICDVIYVMENGKIVESGSYDELCHSSNLFQKMINNINSPYSYEE